MTDEAAQYKLGREFAEHGVVRHGDGEYGRRDAACRIAGRRPFMPRLKMEK